MVPPVRWYHYLTAYMFIFSALYPLHGISTYPLVLLSTLGCVEVFRNTLLTKNLFILFIHLAPFLWIPYDLSTTAYAFSATIIVFYLVFVTALGETPYTIYMTSLSEQHTSTAEFVCERFGLMC